MIYLFNLKIYISIINNSKNKNSKNEYIVFFLLFKNELR